MAALESGRRKRPKWVWVICLFYVFSTIWTLLSFALVYSGAIRLNPAQKVYFENLGIFDFLYTLGLAIVSVVAAIYLFRLRKSAVTLFGIAFAVNITLTVVHAITTTWKEAIAGPGMAGVIIAYIFLIAILLYARSLERRGVLT